MFHVEHFHRNYNTLPLGFRGEIMSGKTVSRGKHRAMGADPGPQLLGGRLAIDFANAPGYPGIPLEDFSWEQLVSFLEAARVVSRERGLSLLALPQNDPQAANEILSRATRLRESVRRALGALVRSEHVAAQWIEPINEILRITEGHDELVPDSLGWKLEFMAREAGSDWLLAAVARSAAEILTEGAKACVRMCANPACGLFFCDKSRTQRRRWCSMAICGNRHKVASFAKKRRTKQ
jgi:predicted RNA-binding Zn ribbon-like protein